MVSNRCEHGCEQRVPSISFLSSLGDLNFSYNLSGRIPSGDQLQTLDDISIYIGK